MSIKEVIEKLDRLEQQIQLILKNNVTLYLQNQELKTQLEETHKIAKQAAKDSAPMRIIGGPILRSNNSNRVRKLIEEGKRIHSNPKEGQTE